LIKNFTADEISSLNAVLQTAAGKRFMTFSRNPQFNSAIMSKACAEADKQLNSIDRISIKRFCTEN
jgi:hypothetical protein